MKLKKLCNVIDFITKVIIWTDDIDEDDAPAWEGYFMDIPWYFMDYKIGRPNADKNSDEPIYISKDEAGYPVMIINLLTEGH